MFKIDDCLFYPREHKYSFLYLGGHFSSDPFFYTTSIILIL